MSTENYIGYVDSDTAWRESHSGRITKSLEENLTKDFIRKNHQDLDLRLVFSRNKFDEPFILEMSKYVSWRVLFLKQNLSIEFIEDIFDELDEYSLENLLHGQMLPESFLDEHFDRFDTRTLFYTQTLSNEFIKKYEEKVPWGSLNYNSTFTEENARAFIDKLDWFLLSCESSYSDQFYLDHMDKLVLPSLMFNDGVSDFVRSHARKIDDVSCMF